MKDKIKKRKKFFLPALGIIASTYFSLVFALWAVIGFFATEIFMEKYMETGRVKSIKLSFKNWELQLHHWLWPGLIILGAQIAGLNHLLPISVLGFAGGVMFQDLYRDKKWHKVIYKKTR